MSLVYADGDHPRLLMGLHGRVTPRKVAPVEVKPSTEEDLRAASDDPDYVTLYHKTPTRNVESIMKSGLLPRYGKPTQGENPAYNAVYFHTDKKKSAGFSTGEPSTVLKVVLPINGDLATRLRPDEDTFHKTAADCVKDGAPVAYRGPVSPEYIEPMNKSLGGTPVQPLLIINLEKSTDAGKPRKWYQDVLDAGGRWVTIKKEDSPLHGRHILINSGGHIVGGKGVPQHIIKRLNEGGNGHIGGHKPIEEHPPGWEPPGEGPVAEPPKEEPKPVPEAPKGGKKGSGEKVGYGDQATMHVGDGEQRTLKHIKNLKHVHGGKWNADQQRWEFNHAHGSEGHKALEDYVKNNGLNLHLIKPGEEAPAPEPKPEKPQYKNEGDKRGAVKITGNTYPHKQAIKDQFGAHWVGYKDDNGKKTGHWQVDDVAHGGDLHGAMQKFADEHGLKLEHEHDEKPARDLKNASLDDLVKDLPSVQEIADYMRSVGFKEPDYSAVQVQNLATNKYEALREIAKDPELLKHAKDIIKEKAVKPERLVLIAPNIYQQALERKQKSAPKNPEPAPQPQPKPKVAPKPKKPKNADPDYPQEELDKETYGDKHLEQYKEDLRKEYEEVKKYRDMVDILKKEGLKKGSRTYDNVQESLRWARNHLKRTVSAFNSRHEQVHAHHQSAADWNDPKNAEYDYGKSKDIQGYKPFEEPPEDPKDLPAYAERAKADMLAHGADHVTIQLGTTDPKQQGIAIHNATTGMRVLHHIMGGNFPPIRVDVKKDANGSTLASYQGSTATITIHKNGQNAFLHEFGHHVEQQFLQALKKSNPNKFYEAYVKYYKSGNTRGKHIGTTELEPVIEAIKDTTAYKARKFRTNGGTGRYYGNSFVQYLNQDNESFARFFSQWITHEARKSGYEIPDALWNVDERVRGGDDHEKYTPTELDNIGKVLKPLLKDRNLWKALMLTMFGFDGDALYSMLYPEPTLYVKL